MPKRIVDGDALWRSQKLSQIQPLSYRAEFANLIPLALANGVFEADPELVWATVYAYNRPDISRDDVVKILAEFQRVGLLLRWVDVNGIHRALNGTPPEGKVWGYWIGIEKPGRLPGLSRQGKNERIGPTPPKSMDSIERSKESNEPPTGTDLCLGFGFGFGSGLGSGAKAGVMDSIERSTESSPSATPPDLHANQYATRLLHEIGYPDATLNIKAVASAIEAEIRLGKSKSEAFEFILSRVKGMQDDGIPVDTFTFTQAQYRPGNRKNGNMPSRRVVPINPAIAERHEIEALKREQEQEQVEGIL